MTIKIVTAPVLDHQRAARALIKAFKAIMRERVIATAEKAA